MMEEVPPFPECLPIIPLPRLSYGKIVANDVQESAKLFGASKNFGCFHLDLSDSPKGQHLLALQKDAMQLGEAFCALDLEEKRKYPLDKSNFGYKPAGVLKFQDGRPDLTELFSLSKDTLLNGSDDDIPSVYADPCNRALLKSWTEAVHEVAMLVVRRLVQRFEVPYSVLERLHDPAKPSGTIIRVNHNFPQPSASERAASLPGHTDTSTITVLFADMGGLQILPIEAPQNDPSAWQWVKPEPSCAIINIGETLVQWTAGLLHSSFHRVLHAPGEQAIQDRYSFGYFLKPSDEAPMHCLREGSVIPYNNVEDQDDANLARYDIWHRVRVKRVYRDQPRTGDAWTSHYGISTPNEKAVSKSPIAAQ